MTDIKILSLHDGINVKSDPAAISEGGLADCIGFDLTIEGALKTTLGIGDNDISQFLPSDSLDCVKMEYIGLTRYVLATTPTGLYANGVLIKSGFVGKFASVGFLNNIFLTNGVSSIRFDGTTCYKWGITAPTTMPTITPGSYLEQSIDTFEDVSDWISHESGGGTISLENSIVKEGSHSLKWVVPAASNCRSHANYSSIDGTKFSNGLDSTDADYFSFWLYVSDLRYFTQLGIIVDVGSGNTYSYTIFGPGYGVSSGVLDINGLGQSTISTASGETSTSKQVTYPLTGVVPPEDIVSSISTTTTQTQIQVLTQNPSIPSAITPNVTNQTLAYWNTTKSIQWTGGVWRQINIPKKAFIATGDGSKNWSTINSVTFGISNISDPSSGHGSLPITVYIDDLKIAGGSDLEGNYWFLYTWGRTDGNGNIIHESSPSQANAQFNVVGPVLFDRHPLVYDDRPLSSDPQVDCGVLYAIGGTLVDFWSIAELLDNTTDSAIVYNIGDSYVNRKLVSKNNYPAPVGNDMVLFKNKIWMIGDPDYPNIVRSSDILDDGSVAPEGWPARNGYDLSGNHGPLLNIKVLNQQVIIRGHFGEWNFRVIDPTDYTSVQTLPVTSHGCIGQYSVIDFETMEVYPSLGGFVQSNGTQANFIMPEVQPLINTNFSTSMGVNAGLVSYFTYNSPDYGDRTAVVDMFKGKPRFNNAYDITFDWLYLDPITMKVYGIYRGKLFLLGVGSTNETGPGKELTLYVKSRTFRPGTTCAWDKVQLIHRTGGEYYRLEVYVDDQLIQSFPFKSSVRTRENFDFGPVEGTDFHFEIKGSSRVAGQIYFPIRIYYGAGK